MTPKKILHFAIGPLGGALLGIISLPIIAWIFSQEDIGKIALLQVVLSFTTLFFTLGLDQGYVREYHESTNRPLLLKTAVLPGFILLMSTLVLCLSFGTFLSQIVFDMKSTGISWLLSVALVCTFISRFLSLVLRMDERGIAFSMSQLLPKAFVLAIILAYFLLDVAKSFEYLLIAYTLAIVLTCFIFIWNTRTVWHSCFFEKIKLQQFKQMLNFGMPLILGGVAFWGLTSIDRVLLSRWSTFSELGVYSVSVSFAAAATIFQSVFSTVWAPTVYKWASKDEGYEKVIMVSRYVLLAVIMLFCFAGLLSWIVPFVLPSEYDAVQWILVACLAYPLLYTLSETTVVGIGISRKSRYALLASALAFCVNFICNIFLIPKFGAAGAASSTAFAFWTFLIFRTEFSILVWKPFPRVALYTFTFMAVAGAIIAALKQDRLGYFLYIYWFVLFIISCWFFRVELLLIKIKIYELVRKKVKN
ncbi:lipopolysaccharide biosynthesis protein [Shewanella sp. HL-SH2]|uniref:lipopolysaccharide biosynthesis protein n=1 Tax=Shewanella sp. HL-SH2 TaxID=3436238 RepID=UPI003EBEBE0D